MHNKCTPDFSVLYRTQIRSNTRLNEAKQRVSAVKQSIRPDSFKKCKIFRIRKKTGGINCPHTSYGLSAVQKFIIQLFINTGVWFNIMEKKLIVVKIGTSSLTRESGDIDRDKISDVVRQVSDLKDEGHNVVIVTSGAIAAGFRALGYSSRPTTVSAKQASAAVGQGLLMEEYSRFFSSRGYICAQILLTRGDFTDKRRYGNAFNSLEVLLARGAVPIINENDTIAVEELKVGDNDSLAAQVAAMLHSDLLIFLTDIDGLYTKNPAKWIDAQRISRVKVIDSKIEALAGTAGSKNGTGGMITKIKGARLATSSGVPVFICSSNETDSIVKAVLGTACGTLFEADGKLKTRIQWLAFYAPGSGSIYVDSGAARALTDDSKSLLPAGITRMEGNFKRGDIVEIYEDSTGEHIGRGLVSFSMEALEKMIKNHEPKSEVAVHKDNLFINKYVKIISEDSKDTK